MCKTKTINEKIILTHFVLFNRIFNDKENLLGIPTKDLLQIKGIKEKHSVELLPMKWQKRMKNVIEKRLV